MSNKLCFSCDTSGFMSMTQNLTGKEMKRVKKSAIRKASSLLAKQTRREMKRAGFKFRKGMEKAVVSRVHRSGNSGSVHLFGQTPLTGKDRGIMRYLELGTKERFRRIKPKENKKRKTKRLQERIPGYAGKITGYKFFQRANSLLHDQIYSAIEITIENGIEKINKSK